MSTTHDLVMVRCRFDVPFLAGDAKYRISRGQMPTSSSSDGHCLNRRGHGDPIGGITRPPLPLRGHKGLVEV